MAEVRKERQTFFKTEEQEKAMEQRKWNARNNPSSLEQMNEKARSHGVSYGQYVLGLQLGHYKDKHSIVKLELDKRVEEIENR